MDEQKTNMSEAPLRTSTQLEMETSGVLKNIGWSYQL